MRAHLCKRFLLIKVAKSNAYYGFWIVKWPEAKRVKDYDNFFLPSNDLKRGKEFYQDILGFSVKFDFSNMGMVAFKVGNNEPAIILKDVGKFPQTKPTMWFVVDNVEEEYGRLKAKGIRFLSEPFPIQTGMAVEFEDPFGNRLGITDYSKRRR
jgi:predicted enzyme related to lactoylglutathione lyase